MLFCVLLGCGGSTTPVQNVLNSDVCVTTAASLPFVQQEAVKLGIPVIELARRGCADGSLLVQVIGELETAKAGLAKTSTMPYSPLVAAGAAGQ